jgi:hypothetical protein
MNSIKKVFTKGDTPKVTRPAGGENTALREILNKTLAVSDAHVADAKPMAPSPAVEPVSLDTLKNKTQEVSKTVSGPKDRAASSEDMNKLKDLISTKTVAPSVSPGVSPDTSPAQHVPTAPIPASVPAPVPLPQKAVPEVPEDVLRKILE